ncbi:MAG TPA: DNA polymerase II [Candidatus Polarisedimenticolia bacterium]|nr:DNA polymerase II [Candidatus Polarisedimenticolia bacterium]
MRGFILHPTYRLDAGRPVVHLFGRLEDGRSFLARDRRLVPYFFIRAADAEPARGRGAARQSPTGLRTMRGEEVMCIEVDAPDQTPQLRDALQNAGVPVFEADVRFAMRYLIDRGIKGAVEIEGAAEGSEPKRAGAPPYSVDVLFDAAEVRPSDFRPAPELLRVLSIDLETDPRGERIYSAALAGPGVAEVLLTLPEEIVRRELGSYGTKGRVVSCGDEKGLLRALFARLREIDFDVLTGWNVIDFDLDVLLARSRALGVPFEVGRAPGAVRVIRERTFWGRSRADITGRLVLDGIDLMKSSFMRLEDYRLDTAARSLLGEGKVDLGGPQKEMSGRDRAQAIERTFRDNLPLFVEYNLADARLVLAILEKARLLDLAIHRSLLTGMPLDRVGASIASFDFLYLHELRKRGRVAPNVGSSDAAAGGEDAVDETVAGGAVLEPLPGLYENVLSFDFKSLYPSLIRTFNIDPLGLVPDPPHDERDHLIRAPNGAFFRREPGILPDLLERLFPQRDEAKKRGDAIGAHALKILMNSFYGVLATPACRFFSLPVANAITHFGQWVLHWTRDRVEALGHKVLYGDTDSLFVASSLEASDPEREAMRLASELRDRINADLRDEIRRGWDVDSRLELEFEALFLKFFLPSMRGGTAGARKRYAGLVRDQGGGAGRVVFVGMEVVRRDWTELSKIYQRGLFERLFRGATGEEVLAYTRDFVAGLREGRHDAHLVYRKALRKGLHQYTATTPPHVKAARLVEGPVEGLVEYVMTTSGPQPAGAVAAPIDHAHYVDKQIRPIAEQVFPHLGLSFDEALGEARQMPLF